MIIVCIKFLSHLQILPPHTYHYVSPKYFTNAYLNFVANVTQVQELTSYLEARGNPDCVKTMRGEIEALELNQTWVIDT